MGRTPRCPVARRSVSDGNQLRWLNSRRKATRIISSSLVKASRPRGSGPRPVIGDRRLTLVLGLVSRADDANRHAIEETTSVRAHADRTIAVNMKLKDAAISAIEAAQVLADTCFCQSHEAAVLDRILSVIDELGDAIRALYDAAPESSTESSPMMENPSKGWCRNRQRVCAGGPRFDFSHSTITNRSG